MKGMYDVSPMYAIGFKNLYAGVCACLFLFGISAYPAVGAEVSTLAFSASEVRVLPGTRVSLNWTADKVNVCVASGSWQGIRERTGVERVTVYTPSTYILRCEATEGPALEQVITIELTTSQEVIPSQDIPSFTFFVTPIRIPRGELARLTWKSPFVGPCLASDGWTGVKNSSDSEAIKPLRTTTYTIQCLDEQGSKITAPKKVTIEVDEYASPPPPVSQSLLTPSDPSIYFTASPSTVRAGEPTTLWWIGMRVRSCASFGEYWTHETDTLGSVQFYPVRSQVFSLQCTDLNGYGLPPLSVFVDVEGTPSIVPRQSNPSSQSFSISSPNGYFIREKGKDRYWYLHPIDQRLYPLGSKKDAFELVQDFAIEKSYVETRKIQGASFNLGGTDTDRDGLSDIFERAQGTSPTDRDTDKDGYDDKTELVNGYDPLGPGRPSFDHEFGQQSSGVVYRDSTQKGFWYVNPRDQKKYFFASSRDFQSIMDTTLLTLDSTEVKKLRN